MRPTKNRALRSEIAELAAWLAAGSDIRHLEQEALCHLDRHCRLTSEPTYTRSGAPRPKELQPALSRSQAGLAPSRLAILQWNDDADARSKQKTIAPGRERCDTAAAPCVQCRPTGFLPRARIRWKLPIRSVPASQLASAAQPVAPK